jgi:hypothetical protein
MPTARFATVTQGRRGQRNAANESASASNTKRWGRLRTKVA